MATRATVITVTTMAITAMSVCIAIGLAAGNGRFNTKYDRLSRINIANQRHCRQRSNCSL
jgi:hypothetical protein